LLPYSVFYDSGDLIDFLTDQYAAKDFGTCPLVQCSGQPVLPVGLKDEMGADTVKIFCPKCQCVYHPPPVRSRSFHHGTSGAAGVDGAAFGTTFPHLFLMTFSNLVPDRLPPGSAYVPRVFGFRVHVSARQRASASVSQIVSSSSKRRRRNAEASKDTTKDTKEEQDQNESSQKGAKTSKVRPEDTKEEDGSKKSKAKRRGDETGGKKSDSNGNAWNDSKRRRTGDNING